MFHSEETEKIVLAYLLKETRYVNISRQVLKDGFFYFKNLARMYGAVIRTFDKWHMTLSYDVLCDLMKSSRLPLEEETLFQILYRELEAIPVDPERFNYYIGILKDLKIKRELQATLSSVTPDTLEGANGEEMLSDLAERFHKMRIDSGLLIVKKNFMFDCDFIQERVTEYEDRKKNGDMAGIPFGWAKLDGYTSGHFPGQVSLVFARTGVGKTRVLTTFAYNASMAGRKGMFVTIEMSNVEIARLYDSRLGRIHFDELKKGTLSPEEEQKWKDLMEAMSLKDDKGLYVVDMPRGCTTASIEEEVNSYERQYGKLDFVVIDYLMLMDSLDKGSATHEKLGNITKELKQLARVKNISVLTAIQANRKVTDNVKKEDVGTEHISLSDQVSAHCNNILYLSQSSNDRLQNTIQVKLVKYRDGGNIELVVHADWQICYIGEEILSIQIPPDMARETRSPYDVLRQIGEPQSLRAPEVLQSGKWDDDGVEIQ